MEKRGCTEEEHVEWENGKAHKSGVCQRLSVKWDIDVLTTMVFYKETH